MLTNDDKKKVFTRVTSHSMKRKWIGFKRTKCSENYNVYSELNVSVLQLNDHAINTSLHHHCFN